MQNVNRDRVGGFNCPVCGSFIPTSMEELMTRASLACPVCNLELTIDKKSSQQAMEAMNKVMEAQKKVESASHFDGKQV